MTTLAMIVHVSDLHFGKSLLQPPSIIQGLNSHDAAACMDFQAALLRLVATRAPRMALVVVSGDLSATGDADEFPLALTWLHSRIFCTRGLSIGLGGVAVTTLAVPGNHDHWRSLLNVVGQHEPAVEIFGPYFDAPERLHVFEERGVQLQVACLDSCGGGVRLVARGSVEQKQLDKLSSDIQGANQRAQRHEFRVARMLVMHHPPGLIPGILGVTHRLDADSRARVAEFCETNKIHTVLTGHVHEPHLPPSSGPFVFGTEFRCGTTFQGPALPDESAYNTFLVHSLVESSPQLAWQTELFHREYRLGFVPAQVTWKHVLP